jgi:L-2-hydroxyglutarate oxidase
MTQDLHTDYLIIGAGIMGLAIARELRAQFPASSITIIEKEDHVAEHASGRNSGVLHAGFYYGADSLKAKFCREGNAAWKAYAKQHGLRLNECGKVVVARNAQEQEMLHELKRRGDVNGVELQVIDAKQLAELEPHARTHEQAIFAPSTAVVDPTEMCNHMASELTKNNVTIMTSHAYERKLDTHTVLAGGKKISAKKIINCAGVYADKIAREFGFCNDYTIIPFKGVYLLWSGSDQPVSRCVYGVPNLANPFLGVHFGVRVDGTTRIGPTSIPAFWRENYHGFERFDLQEMLSIAGWELALFATNPFNFRALAFGEMRKYIRGHMSGLAGQMVQHVDMKRFKRWDRPGIRAQLLNIKTRELVQDFVVEGDANSVHVLNAVSPAFTCSMPFAKWMVEKYL